MKGTGARPLGPCRSSEPSVWGFTASVTVISVALHGFRQHLTVPWPPFWLLPLAAVLSVVGVGGGEISSQLPVENLRVSWATQTLAWFTSQNKSPPTFQSPHPISRPLPLGCSLPTTVLTVGLLCQNIRFLQAGPRLSRLLLVGRMGRRPRKGGTLHLGTPSSWFSSPTKVGSLSLDTPSSLTPFLSPQERPAAFHCSPDTAEHPLPPHRPLPDVRPGLTQAGGRPRARGAGIRGACGERARGVEAPPLSARLSQETR